ncbi:MAG TPA: thioredoxin domain-containing protein [Pseudorhodoplanes sp.]|nr:thioredoxin domain-containing protein [Pseudorhodoplanes sp.]
MTNTPRIRRDNRLAGESSPYLLQHKNNPVEWWPWGPDALAEARRTGKPILLSVGYAACHWCHVMAHESFENEATARLMNELFVNIKVDREERPDIDQIYMSALHMLGEQGGWPLTMFLTPDGEPFWGGTYFPPTARYGRAAFADVLREVARLFREEPSRIEQNRGALMQRLSAKAQPEGRVVVGRAQLDQFALQLAGAIDPRHGGLRGAPKFPQCAMFEFLWRAALRGADDRYFDMIEFTLERICEGGIYDHLGGGFSRYSVDERWLVPHFEKMLYDNAQLLELLALAWQRTGRALFKERARETVGWLTREMTTADGAFCASLDADSEGQEGKFYVWSLAEILSALGPQDGAYFAGHYGVTVEGNFEGRNILNRLEDRPRDAADEARLSALRDKLLAVRSTRIRPDLDDKVLADWNGLMIAALVNAGLALDEPGWIALAARAFGFVEKIMTRGDRLGHSWRADKLLFPGLASDFAAMIRAALALHEATGRSNYLDRAIAWQSALDRHYPNADNGGYYLTADDAEGLVVRPGSTHDDAIPNFNAIAAQNLIRLAVFAGDGRYRQKADTLIEGVLSAGATSLFAHVALLNAIDLRIGGAEIVCVGPDADSLARAALRLPFLNRTVVRVSAPDRLPPQHPARDKLEAVSGSAAFVCVGERCSLPVTRPDDIAAAARAF